MTFCFSLGNLKSPAPEATCENNQRPAPCQSIKTPRFYSATQTAENKKKRQESAASIWVFNRMTRSRNGFKTEVEVICGSEIDKRVTH